MKNAGRLSSCFENVCGALTSHEGKDFAAIGTAVAEAGYRFGALVIDAARFLPQSRPRLFIVAMREDHPSPEGLTNERPDPVWHPANLIGAYEKLPQHLAANWLWWSLPAPPPRKSNFADIVEDEPRGVEWHNPAETGRLLAMMSPLNFRKVEQAKRMGRRMVGGVYKRTR
jgi:DNA (cytosine-5)-methyltransferase 1